MSKHQKEILTAGAALDKADKVVVMAHGRGATAADILTIAQHLSIDGYAIIAPQATNYTWYPYSFLVPRKQNEPWLSSALELLDDLVKEIESTGKKSKQIYFTGFSQGACLILDYVTRHARAWGGVAAFTGGLIGDQIHEQDYTGDFSSTPIFIGSADPDPHVPVQRIEETVRIMQKLNASVTKKIYPHMGHTINEDEIAQANKLIFS